MYRLCFLPALESCVGQNSSGVKVFRFTFFGDADAPKDFFYLGRSNLDWSFDSSDIGETISTLAST